MRLAWVRSRLHRTRQDATTLRSHADLLRSAIRTDATLTAENRDGLLASVDALESAAAPLVIEKEV
jgi:hypothetical protein